MVTLSHVYLTVIPLHVRGGRILPLRIIESANITTEVRTKSFYLLITPGIDGTAEGSLSPDD